jgi:Flp pilus assembly protein TadG
MMQDAITPISAAARGGVLARLMGFLRDRRATVAIEFAFALPILCAMVFTLWEVTQGVICYMKVIDAANSVDDLIGQTSSSQGGVGHQDFDNLYIAGQMVMAPNTPGYLQIAIASVTFDSNGLNPTVAWHAERGGATAMSNLVSFVNGLGTKNGSTIVVQATYSYHSLLNYFITTPITLTSQIASGPRNMTVIPCPPPNGSEGAVCNP